MKTPSTPVPYSHGSGDSASNASPHPAPSGQKSSQHHSNQRLFPRRIFHPASGVGASNVAGKARHGHHSVPNPPLMPQHSHGKNKNSNGKNKQSNQKGQPTPNELSSAMFFLAGDTALNQACDLLLAQSESLFRDQTDGENVDGGDSKDKSSAAENLDKKCTEKSVNEEEMSSKNKYGTTDAKPLNGSKQSTQYRQLQKNQFQLGSKNQIQNQQLKFKQPNKQKPQNPLPKLSSQQCIQKFATLYQKCEIAHDTIKRAEECGMLNDSLGNNAMGIMSPHPNSKFPFHPSSHSSQSSLTPRTTPHGSGLSTSMPPPSLPIMSTSFPHLNRSRGISGGSHTSSLSHSSGAANSIAMSSINHPLRRKASDGSAGSGGASGKSGHPLQRSSSDVSHATSGSDAGSEKGERRGSVEPPPAVLNFLKALNSGSAGGSGGASNEISTTNKTSEVASTATTNRKRRSNNSLSGSFSKPPPPPPSKSSTSPPPPPKDSISLPNPTTSKRPLPPPPSNPTDNKDANVNSNPNATNTTPSLLPDVATFYQPSRKRIRSSSTSDPDQITLHQLPIEVDEKSDSVVEIEEEMDGQKSSQSSSATSPESPGSAAMSTSPQGGARTSKSKGSKGTKTSTASKKPPTPSPPTAQTTRSTRSSRSASSPRTAKASKKSNALFSSSSKERMYEVGEPVLVNVEGEKHPGIVTNVDFGSENNGDESDNEEEGKRRKGWTYDVELDNGDICSGMDPEDVFENEEG